MHRPSRPSEGPPAPRKRTALAVAGVCLAIGAVGAALVVLPPAGPAGGPTAPLAAAPDDPDPRRGGPAATPPPKGAVAQGTTTAANDAPAPPPAPRDEDAPEPTDPVATPAPRSLDDAPAHEIARRLERAIERARRERGIPIADGLVDRVIDDGAVKLIVAQPATQPVLEPRLGAARHRPAHYFRHVPFAAIEVGPQALLDLVDSPDVLGLEIDRKHHPGLAVTVPIISADAATASGFDGSGRVIAVLDTGVDTAHPVFAGRLVDEACFSRDGDCPGGGTREFGPGTGAPCPFGCGHGTLVAGVALGLDPADTRTGVAPDAGLVSIMIYSDDGGKPAAYTSDIIAGLEHVYDLRLFYSIAAANLSLGGDLFATAADCDAANIARKQAIDLLRSASIPTVVSSGNDGDTGQLSEPACISTAVSVGATSKADHVSGFSNSADFLSLLAPGQSVETSRMGGGFTLSSGTSIAAPHVSGAWAAIAEAVPGSNVAEVLFALQSTGEPIVDLRNGITTPRIDVAAAITALDAGIQIEDPVTGPPAVVPPPSLPSGGACGLVGAELLAVAWLARLGRARATGRRRPRASSERPPNRP